MDSLVLKPGRVSLAELRRVARTDVALELDPACRAGVEAAAAVVDRVVAEGRVAYGVNTGFGKLAQTRIPDDRLLELQENLVLSHSVGVGPLLDDDAVRLVLALKAISMARGHSGVRFATIRRLLDLLRLGIHPCIPSKGSVGASGDLAPLAHMTAALIGVGDVRVGGEIMPARAALDANGLEPIRLAPKEGLALLNGTQVSTALALEGLFRAEEVFAAAVAAGALSVEAAKGSDAPFDPRIHDVRGQAGQSAVAGTYRALLAGSELRASHLGCAKVQDPYCLRCQPQVMGAALDLMGNAARVLVVEANAVSDNPLIFPDTGEIISGGNFHAEPVAMAADTLAIAIAEIGALSERRIAMLTDSNISGLPPFLVSDSGLNSGFMIAHVTAAALASENKALAHPSSVDSLPTSANQEDHVSMATHAARRLGDMAENVAGIAAIELLAAAQGLDFHRPLRTSETLEDVQACVRACVPRYQSDRFFAPDIEAMKGVVESGRFLPLVAGLVPSSIG